MTQIQMNLEKGIHKRALKYHCPTVAVDAAVSSGKSTVALPTKESGKSRWEQTIAMHLIDKMLQKDPAHRPSPAPGVDKSLCMQVVLQHPFFMTATEKLADIARGKDTNWTRLRKKTFKHRSGADFDWRKIAKLKTIQQNVERGGQHYGKDFAELARLVRNARVHLQENPALQEVFGVHDRDDAVATDEKVEHYFAMAMPAMFLHLIQW